MQLLNAGNVTPQFEEGDAGIILKKDGENFQLFNLHERLDADNMTQAQHKQGELLIALSVVLQTEKLREMILGFAADVMAGKGDIIAMGTAH